MDLGGFLNSRASNWVQGLFFLVLLVQDGANPDRIGALGSAVATVLRVRRHEEPPGARAHPPLGATVDELGRGRHGCLEHCNGAALVMLFPTEFAMKGPLHCLYGISSVTA